MSTPVYTDPGNRDRRLRVLTYQINYWPEELGGAPYGTEMCEWLACRGHDVTVLCSPPHYPQWRVWDGYNARRYRVEQRSGVRILRCPVWIPRNPTGRARLVCAASFALASLPALLKQITRKPDVILVSAPSLMAAPLALLASYLCGAVSWLHIQDFELDVARNLGHLTSQTILKLCSRFERHLFARFSVVSTISQKMLLRAHEKGAKPNKSVLFPNWVDTQAIDVLPTDGNRIRSQLRFTSDDTVCLFSGSMVSKQGAEVVVDAARILHSKKQIRFVLCGEGSCRPVLEEKARGLDNVFFLPLQPREKLGDLLSCADIHLLPQRPSIADLVLPSKLITMLASGRPVVATATTGTEIHEIVSRCGIVVEPGKAEDFADAISVLAADPGRRTALGLAARGFAESTFSRDTVMRSFEKELMRFVSRRRPVQQASERRAPDSMKVCWLPEGNKPDLQP